MQLSRVIARTFTVVAAASVLSLAGCGDKNTVAPVPVIEDTNFAPSLGVDLAASTKTASGMYWRDLVVGTGATASTNEVISVRYRGAFPNGVVFDEITGTETPFEFQLGVGDVIAGWDEGVVGMKVGGRRQLIIPPSLGYGASDYGPIPGNSILVFTVDLVAAP